MAFTLTTRAAGEVTVLDLSGRLEIGEGSAMLRESLHKIPSGAKVVINLTDVPFIDTSGLGEFVSGHTRAQSEGTHLKLAGIPERVKKLFQMTGLDKILEIYDNEEDAIQSWGGGSFGVHNALTETAA